MTDIDLLLVDDDPTFCQVLARALNKRGYSTATAHTGEQALQIAATQPPRGAVVDLKLADESGLALIDALRRQLPELKIVMLTGYASIATAVEAVKLGATHYLCKPASVDEILAAFDLIGGNPAVPVPEQPPSVDRLEWEHIQKVLQDNAGNISATARALGMHRRTMQRKLYKRPVRR
jgi:two-component system response regulator RegA